MSCEVCRGSGCEMWCPCCRKKPEPIESEWTYYDIDNNECSESDNWFVREDQFGYLEYNKRKN